MSSGELLARTIAAIVLTDDQALAAAENRQLELTKPVGSLGQLEWTGNRLCAIYRQCPPPCPRRAIAGVFCGDHGVTAQGISPWHQELTQQMAINVCKGGASINALAAQAGVEVWAIDVGCQLELPESPTLRRCRVRPGTGDITQTRAMTRDEAVAAIEVGIQIAREAVQAGADLLIPGEVGIGNTTVAAAMIAAMTGSDAARVTGRGAGSGDQMLARKIAVVQRALDLHRPDPGDPIGVLSAVGGLEHAAIAGFLLGGAALGVPLLLDGVIACAAALIAVRLCPTAAGYLLAGHAGAEPGIDVALQQLDLQPLVDLGMRLGEGGGAAVAFPIVQASANVLRLMATFSEAAVNADHDEL